MNRKIVIMALVVFLVVGWQQYFVSKVDNITQYNKYMNLADEKFQKELYQESFQYYEKAYGVKPTTDAVKKEVKAYTKFYEMEQSYEVFSELNNILEKSCQRCPEEKNFWEQRFEVLLNNNEYDEALGVYKKIIENGIKSKHIDELKNILIYSYEIGSSYFIGYKEETNGIYAICMGTEWKAINEKGEPIQNEKKYLGMGQINQDNIFLCMRDNKNINFMDTDGVIKGIVKENVTDYGMYNCGLCPVVIDNEYYYIDIDGNKKLGPYLYAGTFEKNKAAVQNQNGRWGVIDKEGKYIVEAQFEDIKLTMSGGYSMSDMVIAKKNGKYNIYDEEMKKVVSEINAEDTGIITKDNIIAYKKENKWGYVSLKGKIVIKPQYEGAKSFSNGFAAVQTGENNWKLITKDNKVTLSEDYYDIGYMNQSGGIIVSDQTGMYQLIIFKYPEMFN